MSKWRVREILNQIYILPTKGLGDTLLFIGKKPQFAYLRERLERELRRRTKVKLFSPPPDSPKQPTLIYLLKSGKYYKIGATDEIEIRLSALQMGNPFLIKLIDCVYVDDGLQEERALHSLFAEKRIRGEWFCLSPKEVEEARKRFNKIRLVT